MKQNLQICKKKVLLLLFFLVVITISAKSGSTNIKNNNYVKQESTILQKLKVDPVFVKYFKNTRNSTLSGLLKSQVSEPKIDSIVSASYDTSYQKVKNTYEYDANGYISGYVRKYYKNGAVVNGESYTLEWRSDGQLKNSTYMKKENGVWINNRKETYTYDPDGNRISYITENWDTSASNWVYNRKHEYTYDANHNLLSDTRAYWSSGAWENRDKYEWTYDANNNQTMEVYKKWNSGAWENSRMYEWTYDANNSRTLEVYKRWSSGAWKNSSKTTFTYDGNGNLISENEYDWVSSSSSWENYYWTLYTYNANNKLTFKTRKKWDDATSSWIDYSRTNISYTSSGKFLHLLTEQYKNGNWENDYENVLIYDADDKITSYIERSNWNENKWNNNYKYNFRYNSDGYNNGGSCETWFSGHWVSADAQWVMFRSWILEMFFDENWEYMTENDWMRYYLESIPGYEYSVYFNGVTNVKENREIPQVFTLAQNYPNPFNPSTKINYALPSAEHVTLKVYDILGNEIKTLVNKNQTAGSYTVNFDATNLTSGIYFYQITAGSFTKVHKMMLIK